MFSPKHSVPLLNGHEIAIFFKKKKKAYITLRNATIK